MGFGGSGGGGSVASSSDVALNSPTNNQVLTYDSSLAKWKNAAGGSGGGVDAETVSDMMDVALVQTVKKPVSWAASTSYAVGDYFSLSYSTYRVVNAFTSGTDAPVPADARPVTPDSDFEIFASPSSVGSAIVRRSSDGAATFSRVYSLMNPTAATELTNKQYVDEAIDNVTMPTRPASMLTIVWNGSAWTYRGTVISAQPTDRITGDVVMFVGNPGGTLPTWAITNDIWTQG